MKTQLAIAFSVVCCLALFGQEERQTPSKITATVVGPRVLKPGDTLKLIVRLTPAPNGYGGGEVRATIENSDKSVRGIAYGDFSSTRQSVPMQDGVSEYVFQFPVTPYFISGEWKVGSVEFGRAIFTKLDVIGQDTFKIDTDEPPIVVTVSGPKTVVNGTKGTFHVSIDKPVVMTPNQPCEDVLIVQFYPSGGSAGNALQTERIYFKPDTLSYDVPFERFPDAQPTGQWLAQVSSQKIGMTSHCPKPKPIAGQQVIAFEVLPATNLVVPQAVQVTLNPSEIELLRAQASSLRAKVNALQNGLSEGRPEENRHLLQQSVAEALQALTDTEDAYKKQAKIRDYASSIFFDDLRRNYHDSLIKLSAQREGQWHLRYVAAQSAPADNIATAVIGSMLHNIDAYDAAANAKQWTFTLKLRTEPPGAKISYCRKPDPFVPFDQDTNSNIENLPIAIWFVRFEKVGYKDEVVRYDATTETDPIYKKLTKVRGRPAR